MAHNTKARAEELLAAGRRLVTPELTARLDALADPDLGLRILEAQAAGDRETARELEQAPHYQARRAGLRALEKQLRDETGCSHPSSRHYIATALRRRRGEAVKADGRGGYRPGSGAPAGNQNWRGRVAAAMEAADTLTDGGRHDPAE